jgi:hypothetical protein
VCIACIVCLLVPDSEISEANVRPTARLSGKMPALHSVLVLFAVLLFLEGCVGTVFFSVPRPLAGFFKLFERRCGDDDVATVNCVRLS